MTTAAGSLQIVPESPPSAPALRAADQGIASALEFVLSDNTKRVHAGQWRLFNETSGGRSTGVGPSFPAPGSRKREGQPDIAPALTAAPEGWVLRRSAR